MKAIVASRKQKSNSAGELLFIKVETTLVYTNAAAGSSSNAAIAITRAA